MATFLLTYRSFTTPEELLHFVMRRYETTAPADLDKEGLRLWEASEMLPIRLRYTTRPIRSPRAALLNRTRTRTHAHTTAHRVINVLKSWISDHFYDFYDSKTLLDTLKDFVDKQLSVPTNLKGPLQQLKKSIETNEMERRARKEYMFSSKPPKSVISKKVAKAKPQEIDLRDIDPIEVLYRACHVSCVSCRVCVSCVSCVSCVVRVCVCRVCRVCRVRAVSIVEG